MIGEGREEGTSMGRKTGLDERGLGGGGETGLRCGVVSSFGLWVCWMREEGGKGGLWGQRRREG